MDPAHPSVPSRAATAFRVAWLSILLGVAMEALLLVVATAFGRALQAKQIFPVGCSLVLYAAQFVGDRFVAPATTRG